MSTYVIMLDGDELTEETDFAQVDGWWTNDNIVHVTSSNGGLQSRYALPRGRARVTVDRTGKGRARLVIGGFTTTTVSVVGPVSTIEKLREAVL